MAEAGSGGVRGGRWDASVAGVRGDVPAGVAPVMPLRDRSRRDSPLEAGHALIARS